MLLKLRLTQTVQESGGARCPRAQEGGDDVAAADLMTEEEAAYVLGRNSDECLAVYCEEGQAVFLAAAAAEGAQADRRSCRIVVPNGNAREAVKRALGGRVANVDVSTIGEIALAVVTDAAVSTGDVPPVVLDAVQRRLLFEDLKVLGGKPRRIEELCKFLCRGVAEFAFEDPDWLISDEERTVLKTLWAQLCDRGALLPSFVGAAAYRALEDDDLASRWRIDDLFAVGFTAYDEASQHVAACLADRMVAFGRADDPGVPEIAFGHPEGMAKWASYGRTLTVAPSRRRIVRAVRCRSDEQELATVVEFLRSDIAKQGSTTLIVQNGYWQQRYASALAEAGIAAEYYQGPALAGVDPRRAERGADARFYGVLALAAAPESVLARRTWLGLGEWLGGSDMWEALRLRAEAADTTVAALMDELTTGAPLPPFSAKTASESERAAARLVARAAERLVDARRLATRIAPLRGDALVEAVAQEAGIDDASRFSALLQAAGEDAATLFERLRRAMETPSARGELPVVIARAADASYLVSDGIVVTGVVDGLACRPEAADLSAPLDVRRKAYDEGAARLKASLPLGGDFAVITCFDSMDLMEASRAGAEIKSIRAEGGSHRARTAPATFMVEYLTEG